MIPRFEFLWIGKLNGGTRRRAVADENAGMNPCHEVVIEVSSHGVRFLCRKNVTVAHPHIQMFDYDSTWRIEPEPQRNGSFGSSYGKTLPDDLDVPWVKGADPFVLLQPQQFLAGIIGEDGRDSPGLIGDDTRQHSDQILTVVPKDGSNRWAIEQPSNR